MSKEEDVRAELKEIEKELREIEKYLPPEYQRFLALRRKVDKLEKRIAKIEKG